MAEHDEVYNEERAQRLAALLRALAERIQELDRSGQLLRGGPELLRLMGDARSELFHYEVRSTYDTPEVADSRRKGEWAPVPLVPAGQRCELCGEAFRPADERAEMYRPAADGTCGDGEAGICPECGLQRGVA